MKICRYDQDRLGVVQGDTVVDVTTVVERRDPIRPWPLPRTDWLITHLAELRPELEYAAASGPRKALSEVKLLSPLANPGKIIGAPVNYYAHQAEANADKTIGFGRDVKTIADYGLFLKANSSLVGPSQGVELRLPERRHDHEGELCLVIGSPGAHVAEHDALAHVAAYCTGLDMTARGVEERSLRKSFDSYTVLGPWLTTADEIANPDDLLIHLEVNGEQRQHCNTDQLIYSVRKLIAYASEFYTLYPGDVVMTGTPAGVGPVVPGDRVHLEITGLGAMDVNVR